MFFSVHKSTLPSFLRVKTSKSIDLSVFDLFIFTSQSFQKYRSFRIWPVKMKVNLLKSIRGETLPSFLRVESFKSIDLLPVKVYALKHIDATLPSFLDVKSHFCIIRKSSEGLKIYKTHFDWPLSTIYHFCILFCFLMILTFGAFDS